MKTNLFLIIGDPFLRSQKAKTIAAVFEKNAGGQISHQTFRLDETPMDVILMNAKTLPFLVQGQIFYIQNIDRMKAADLELLASYAAQPAVGTALIFEAEEISGKEEFLKFMKANGEVISPAKEEVRSAAQSYLQQKLTRSGKTMTPATRQQLLEMCGEAVVFLDSMLDRLLQYAADKKEIDEDMVGTFAENWKEVTVFNLTDALLARDAEKSIAVFRRLLEDFDTDIQALIGIIHWQLRALWHGAVLLASGVPESEMLARVKVPPFRKQAFLAAVRAFGPEKLEKALDLLYQLDKKSKIGQADGVSGLESWLLQFTAK